MMRQVIIYSFSFCFNSLRMADASQTAAQWLDASQTAVAAPDHALTDRSRRSTELDDVIDVDVWALLRNSDQSAPDTEGERFLKPKAEFAVGIPESSTPGPGTAVAAKPRAKRSFLRLNKFTINQFMRRIRALEQETYLSNIEDDGLLPEDEIEWGKSGSGPDNDVESNGSGADLSQDADCADPAVSGGPSRWCRDEQIWHSDDCPSRWCPSPSADRSRGPSTQLQHRAKRRTEVDAYRSRGAADVFTEESHTDLRRGVKRTGTVDWLGLEQMADNACINNLLISHVMVGEECDVDEFANGAMHRANTS